MMKSILIDDESGARGALKLLLEKFFPNIKIIGEANSVASGEKLILETQPDLVFLDVEMPDGTGFNLLERLEKHDFHIVFVTAHHHYAIKAIRFAAADYLLKPVDLDELREAIERLAVASPQKSWKEMKPNLEFFSGGTRKISIPTQESVEILDTDNILYLKADNVYSEIFFKDGMKFVATRSIRQFEEALSDAGFMRINKSYLVNLKFARRFLKQDSQLELVDGSLVPVSRGKKAELLQWMTRL